VTVRRLPGNASASEAIPRLLCQLLQGEERVFQMIECSKEKYDVVFLAREIELRVQINRLDSDRRVERVFQNPHPLETIEVCRFIVDYIYRQALILQEKREVPIGGSNVCDLPVLALTYLKQVQACVRR
jgi:hypothetical protein